MQGYLAMFPHRTELFLSGVGPWSGDRAEAEAPCLLRAVDALLNAGIISQGHARGQAAPGQAVNLSLQAAEHDCDNFRASRTGAVR